MQRFEVLNPELITTKSSVSIERRGLIKSQTFLLNQQYDLKIRGLNTLIYSSYNKNHRELD